MENKNIFEIKNIRHNILKFLIKPKCQNCLENETKNFNNKYCDWCGYNIYFFKLQENNNNSKTL